MLVSKRLTCFFFPREIPISNFPQVPFRNAPTPVGLDPVKLKSGGCGKDLLSVHSGKLT